MKTDSIDSIKPLSVPGSVLSSLNTIFFEVERLETFSLSDTTRSDLSSIRANLSSMFRSLILGDFFNDVHST